MHPLIQLPIVARRRARLEVHELTRTHVLRRNARVRPFTTPLGFANDPNQPTRRDPLEFTMWELFHATKKAELIGFKPGDWMFWPTVGSLMEHFELFAPAQELRLNPGMSRLYGDFTSTGLAGRLGQGLTVLFMQQQGYPYGVRLEALLALSQGRTSPLPPRIPNNTRTQNPTPNRAPDFIFEHGNHPNRTALAESKGSFVHPRSQDPNVVGHLREGLNQLHGWDRCLSPAPHKGFVVNAIIREEGDPSTEPPMLCFVDPDSSTEGLSGWNYPKDLIRRCNYAAWLRQVGFQDTAADLIAYRRREALRAYTFSLIDFGGRKIGIPWDISRRGLFFFEFFERDMILNSLVHGIELNVLLTIGKALDDPTFTLGILEPQQNISIVEGPTVGSLFSDGTFLGKVNEEVLFRDKPDQIKL